MLNMTNLRHYIAPAVAALATAASIASVTIGQAPAKGAEPANTLSAAEKKAGWTLLFDGKTLNGWRGYKKTDATGTRWKVEDGLLTVDPGSRQGHPRPDGHRHHEHVRSVRVDMGMADRRGRQQRPQVFRARGSELGYRSRVSAHRRRAASRRQDRTASSDRSALRRAASGESPAQARRPVQPEPRRLERHNVEHYLNGKKVLQYELDSPALRAAIDKSKFKDIERFGKLQNGSSLYRITATASGIGTSRSTACPRPEQDVGGSDSAWREGCAGRRERQRQEGSTSPSTATVYVVHLSRHDQEASALSASDVERHGRDTRLPARAAAARARRPSASRRPVVQPWRRERARLLEQLRTTSRPIGRRRWAPSHHKRVSRPRAAPIAASWPSRWTG